MHDIDDDETSREPEDIHAMTKREALHARRRFLLGGLGLAGAVATEPGTAREAIGGFDLAPTQRTPGSPFSSYGQPAAHERAVMRQIAANPAVPGNGASWTPLEELEGSITPSGLHFERHHNGVPDIDPAEHRVSITGGVRKPLVFDMAGLLKLPRSARQCFIECGGNSFSGWRRKPIQASAGALHGLVSGSEWSGVPLRILLEQAEVEPGAGWLIAQGADAFSLSISVPLAKAMDDCLLALYQNGERLRPEQGYPVRLLVPGWEGVLHCKWLKNLTVADQPSMARNETARYTELGPDGRARMFTFVMQPKSLITWPSAQQRLPRPGHYAISGLAWSGHGRVASVEVSTDGGRHWQAAHLESPLLPCALTRFRLPWYWSGRPAVLQSRTVDEHGHRQPSRAELLQARGDRGYFHYNAVVSWAVSSDGELRHAYPDAQDSATEFDDLFMDEK